MSQQPSNDLSQYIRHELGARCFYRLPRNDGSMCLEEPEEGFASTKDESLNAGDRNWFEQKWAILNPPVPNDSCVTTTDLIYIGDRSGSMSTMGGEPLAACNAFIQSQKEGTEPGTDPQLYLWLFDHTVRKHASSGPLQSFEPLTEYPLGGTTALFDAIGMAIQDYEMTQRNNPVVCVILTDGEENASQKFKRQQISEMISEREAPRGEWKFVFLAAHQDAFAAGEALGVKRDNCANFRPELGRDGITELVERTGDEVRRYRSCVAMDRTSSQSVEINTRAHTQ